MIQKNLLFFFLLSSFIGFGQNKTDKEFLDSIKGCFINHKAAHDIDTKWLKDVYTDDLFEELQQSVADIDLDTPVEYDELSTELLKKRLKKLDSKSPFNIEYHPSLENVIKYYLKNRKHSYERLMAVSQYYFPMFECALAKYKIPLEIKYLAIVESALNPRAISRVGAAGLWQFMYQTGKEYNLEVNSYVDDRYHPVKATEAACQYLSNMYRIFGDWDLVLASYNSGPGNVSKAIRRSNGQKNYWNIRHNLPKETQGYLPAFLATMYIFEYHKEHGIKPNKAKHNFSRTDTIVVKQQISFETVSEVLDIPKAEISFLNPTYKLDIVPYIEGEKNSIRLPLDKIGVFVSNEKLIYEYNRYKSRNRERIAVVNSSDNSDSSTPSTKYHTVRKGETASGIAHKYGVSTHDLSKWNQLVRNRINKGQRLKIYVGGSPSNSNNSNEKSVSKKVSSPKYHTVRRGETLSSISSKYNGVSVTDLKKWNKLRSSNIQIGDKLKVSQ